MEGWKYLKNDKLLSATSMSLCVSRVCPDTSDIKIALKPPENRTM